MIEGYVLIFGPVVPPPGSTTTRPIASFTTTVEAKQEGKVFASERIGPGEEFHLGLPVGSYHLTASGVPFCEATATVTEGRTTHVDVRCVEP
jgi:hypothetical protein